MNKNPNDLHESIDDAVKEIADIFRNTGNATDSSEPIGYDLKDWFPNDSCIKCKKQFKGGRFGEKRSSKVVGQLFQWDVVNDLHIGNLSDS